MAQPTDPKTPAQKSGQPPTPSAERVYQRAVAAYKEKQYAQALGLFKRLTQLPPDSPYRLKALMGQVRVYQRLDQVEQARSSCQALLNSASPQAHRWAHQVLGQLSKGPPEEAINAPLAETKTAAAQPLPPPPSRVDLSGFVPLASSGPLPPRSSPPPPPDPAPPLTTPADIDDLAPPVAQEPAAAAHQSLFHFQQLNQQLGTGQTDAIAPPPSDSQPPPAPSPRPGRGERPVPAPSAGGQSPLPRQPLGLWLAQGLTAIALLWLSNWGIHGVVRAGDGLLRSIRWPVQLGLPGAAQNYTVWIVGGLVLLALASPWMMDFALTAWYGQKPLSTRQLQGHSPAALRLLRQICRQQGWQLPELRVISDPACLCFSYGWLARNTRIVVSQGLLDQSSDAVLGALYGYELARMVNGSVSVLSSTGFPLLLLHTGYRRLARLGDTITQPLGRFFLGVLSSVLYGLFWLLRQLVLWLSRLCCSWGDRRAVALTQHPDHLAEGLLQLTQAIARDLQRRGTLYPLYTSLEVLMPVSGRQAITPGSLLERGGGDRQRTAPANDSLQDCSTDRALTIATLVSVDGLNPYRQWLRVSASHPALGERLLALNHQATLRQQTLPVTLPLNNQHATNFSISLLLLQKGPLAGLLLGGGIAMALWFVGGIVNRLGWQRLSWLYQDPSVLVGGLCLGLGLGLLLRINTLFPDLGNLPSPGSPDPAASDTVVGLLHNTSDLPVRGKPVTLRGQLHGLPGLANGGCQELYLDDASGLVKLVNPVPLGSLQGLFQRRHPSDWLGRMVTLTGWGRYGGGMLWIDIHQIQLDSRHRFQAYGPAWVTLLSLGSSLIGIVTIFRGG
ncbi:M48 family metalloprotease [Nodosilinea sp. PGN35]|uniref:M48 family metalloprotease n=1 Tax=Nodosilinea sp. PGN35 TaxID=3020489 RepID=UPI0023B274DA|nr:M48 family metalloprotease [Nodosilinea sp. TSF1-S3]MDF0369244.1 M48 family metalloprotease [Nodosilinea sp. TSF1-S3]